ncbi:hypothetical protein DdX_17858 [Ditylenchus destructor]|uniref:NTR domain-containing protein n=1 Tax=Ditylenchus destructor TaxID=166010 RepID=A0AAD4QT63_9BILA|nr:hypothetical protein DdX_17858 [Ditylenchus destructor]
MMKILTFTFALFLPFAHSCWSSCPSEDEIICNTDWISLVKVIDSNSNKEHIRYTLKHLHVFKVNGTFTSWRYKELLGSDQQQLPIFLDANTILTTVDPKLLHIGKTYILSGPRATDSLKIYACTSISRLVDDVSKDALVQKIARTRLPDYCATMMREAEK